MKFPQSHESLLSSLCPKRHKKSLLQFKMCLSEIQETSFLWEISSLQCTWDRSETLKQISDSPYILACNYKRRETLLSMLCKQLKDMRLLKIHCCHLTHLEDQDKGVNCKEWQLNGLMHPCVISTILELRSGRQWRFNRHKQLRTPGEQCYSRVNLRGRSCPCTVIMNSSMVKMLCIFLACPIVHMTLELGISAVW